MKLTDVKVGALIRFIKHADDVGPVPHVGALLVVRAVDGDGAITADRYRERHLVWPEEIELVERRTR